MTFLSQRVENRERIQVPDSQFVSGSGGKFREITIRSFSQLGWLVEIYQYATIRVGIDFVRLSI